MQIGVCCGFVSWGIDSGDKAVMERCMLVVDFVIVGQRRGVVC